MQPSSHSFGVQGKSTTNESANGSGDLAAGMVVLRGSTPVGRVTFVDPATGMVAVESLPVKPRAKNWYTQKEWRESGLSVSRPNPPG